VLVSHEGNPDFLASDLVAQAEHDPEACAAFVTTSAKLAAAVIAATQQLSADKPIAQQSLAKNGVVLLAADRNEAMAFANAIASEHLTVDDDSLAQVRHAGSVFVGDYSPQALGDYASGPNHVLPTGAVARHRGGLSVLDYVKIVSVQEASRTGLQKVAPLVTTLAEAEGLRAHAESVRIRTEKKAVGVGKTKRREAAQES
jgi:histidinol dehydrogenase